MLALLSGIGRREVVIEFGAKQRRINLEAAGEASLPRSLVSGWRRDSVAVQGRRVTNVVIVEG